MNALSWSLASCPDPIALPLNIFSRAFIVVPRTCIVIGISHLQTVCGPMLWNSLRLKMISPIQLNQLIVYFHW